MIVENTKGEFYEKISQIITLDEAWDLLVSTDEFELELDEIVESRQIAIEKEARAELEKNWREGHISDHDGFCYRSDGMVEIEG